MCLIGPLRIIPHTESAAEMEHLNVILGGYGTTYIPLCCVRSARSVSFLTGTHSEGFVTLQKQLLAVLASHPPICQAESQPQYLVVSPFFGNET